ncbi:hypothetical protein FLBR109950_01595 [Flavobacterium branchiophilum]
MKLTTSILHHAGTDPKDRKELEDEQEAWRTIDALTGNIRHKTDQLLQIISEKEQALIDKDKENEALKQQIALLMNKKDK